MSPLTNTLHLQLTPMLHATSTVTTITKSSPIRIPPTILLPTHRHPLEQSTTEHQSRPFPTDLQAPFTLLLQCQTVYLHTTIDNYTRCTVSYMLSCA